MDTLKKTIYIPSNHQIKLDLTLPENFPVGETELLLIFAKKTALQTTHNNEKLQALAGRLKNSAHFRGDPLTLQKELRDEWQH